MLKSCCAALLGSVLISTPGYGQTQPSSLASAKEMLKAGHPDQSLALVEPIIAQAMLNEAKDPRAVCPSAAVALLQSFMKNNYSVSIENDWCDAMLVKGYALNELKRPSEAAQVLGTLVGHAPYDPNYLIEYAYTIRVNGELERSLDLYKQAETAASKLQDRQSETHLRAVALRGQGFALTELQRWDDSKRAYERSLKYEPENEIARNELRYIEENRPH